MTRSNDAGAIPLDDVRSNGHGHHDPPPKPPKERNDSTKQDESDLIEFTEEEQSAPTIPTRKYHIPMNVTELFGATKEDDEDGTHERPESIASSFEEVSADETSFETTTFHEAEEFKGNGFGSGQNTAHLQQLYATISSLTRERQVAEEKAQRALERVDELKEMVNSGMSDISKDAKALTEEMEKLRDEKRHLKEQLSDAQSHIFSLQPYRKELTAEAVGQEYDDLVESIQEWVRKLMEPLLDDMEAGAQEVLNIARKRTMDLAKFKKSVHKYPDLVHASTVPDTDEDAIVGIILRFLHDNIFQRILYGALDAYTDILSAVENLMQTAVEPKRDLFSVRSWTAEAYNALLSAPQFKSVRNRKCHDLSVELATILKVFCRKEKLQAFFEGIYNSCVSPAMKLYEKLQVSTHHFYLDVNPFMAWSTNGNLMSSAEFLDTLNTLDCRNVLQHRKAFNLAKLDPEPTPTELRHDLVNVCTVVPALMMRQVGQRDAIKEPVTVRKQQMLVAWGPEEKRRKFMENGEATIVAHLFQAGRGQGGGWSSAFRRG